MTKTNTHWTEQQLADVLKKGTVKAVVSPFAIPAGNKYDFFIGVDTGVNTGFAMWCLVRKELIRVETIQIDQALEVITMLNETHKLKVRIEDARLRRFFTGGREKAQGVGSVKRDAKIFEQYCQRKNIDYELVAPKDNKTKLEEVMFKRITGWKGRTSNHARDAAMLVFNAR